MINIFITFSYCYCFPKLFNAFNKLFFVCRLDDTPVVLFQLMSEVFNWITIRGLSGSSPPVDPICCKKIFGFVGCVLGIVVSHESVICWIDLVNKWQQCFSKHFNLKWSIHDTFKNANSSGASY